jgi:hypothetical protein
MCFLLEEWMKAIKTDRTPNPESGLSAGQQNTALGYSTQPISGNNPPFSGGLWFGGITGHYMTDHFYH